MSTEGVRPLITIVTPTLNQGRFIEDTIRSIKRQTYPYFEHIVVDGGSTDDTIEVLRRHEGAYDLRWLSEPDRGMYDAINKGLEMARGEILCYLNSDDLFLPWTLEAVVEALESDLATDVVYGDAVRVDELEGEILPWLQASFDRRAIAAWGSLIQPTVFWRRRVLESTGYFDKNLRFVGDLDLWLRVAGRHRIAQLDEFLAIDRVHAQAASDAIAENMKLEELAVRRAHAPRLSRLPGAGAAARTRAAWLRRVRWIRFYQATRGQSERWRRSRVGGSPQMRKRAAILGLLPIVGRRHLASVRWSMDPRELATGELPGAENSPSRSLELPLVSVITPSYNQAKYLEDTLRSVANQDYPRVEHIVMDGGSSDGSVELLRRWAESHPLSWRSERDRGQADAISMGSERCSGEIIAWLNSDDVYLDPGVISAVVELFRRGAQIVSGAGWYLTEDGEKQDYIPVFPDRLDHQTLRCVDWILQPATFVRRDIFLSCPIDLDLHFAFDWDLFIRLTENALVTSINRPLAGYRRHPTGKTISGGIRRQLELLEVTRRYNGERALRTRLLRAVVWLHMAVERLPWAIRRRVDGALDRFAAITHILTNGRGIQY